MDYIFQKNFVPATVYNAMLNRAFGEDWKMWEPETLWEAIGSHFGGQPSDTAKSAIQAIRTVQINDLYFEDLNGFEDITLGLNNQIPNFQVIEVCTPAEILYGYRLMKRVRSPRSFTHEVQAYVQACFKQAGQVVYPLELNEFAADKPHEADRLIRARALEIGKPGAFVRLDDLVDVQAAKLHDCEAYVRARLDEARKEMTHAG